MYVDNGWAQTAVVTVPNLILFFYLKCVNMREYFDTTNRPYFHKKMYIEGTDRYVRRQKKHGVKQPQTDTQATDGQTEDNA